MQILLKNKIQTPNNPLLLRSHLKKLMIKREEITVIIILILKTYLEHCLHLRKKLSLI